LVRRALATEQVAQTVKKLTDAIKAPILYPDKGSFTLSAAAEYYPTKLPPLRSDSPTLVVGKLNKAAKLDYAVAGKVAGKPVKVAMSEAVPGAEIDNFFLVGMVEQWKKSAEAKEAPSPFRAARALAMSQDRARLARDDFKEHGAAAVEMGDLNAAAQMFAFAKNIDPNDPEVDAGMKIVDKMKNGALTKDKLKAA